MNNILGAVYEEEQQITQHTSPEIIKRKTGDFQTQGFEQAKEEPFENRENDKKKSKGQKKKSKESLGKTREIQNTEEDPVERKK